MDFTWLAVLVSLGVVIYWHLTRTFSHWKNKGVFYLTPQILFGNLKERMLFRISFHEFQRNLYNKCEGHRVAGIYEGRRPSLMIRDPQLIRDVMVGNFDFFTDRPSHRARSKKYIEKMLLNLKGQHWKQVRSILTPTFSSGKLRIMQSLVNISGEQLKEFLETNISSEEQEFEMKELFGRFTMDVIASCAFGVQCNSLKQPNAEFATMAAKFNDISLPKRLYVFFLLFVAPSFLFRFLTLPIFNLQVLEYLANLVQNAREVREHSPECRRNDFLQLMLDAAQKETKENRSTVLDDDTITGQAILFLLAGFETSSTLLTFASYELAINPEIQEHARDEITTILKKHDGVCSYEALQEMNYLENVLLETLRKHPPVARLDRLCTSKYTLDLPDKTISVEPGSSVFVSVIGLHYDPQYFPNPEVFDPDRFLPENRSDRSPYVFLPFGEGPRNCIGKRFALISTKIAMVHLLKDYVVSPSSKTTIPYQFSKFSMFLKAKDGIFLHIKRLKL